MTRNPPPGPRKDRSADNAALKSLRQRLKKSGDFAGTVNVITEALEQGPPSNETKTDFYSTLYQALNFHHFMSFDGVDSNGMLTSYKIKYLLISQCPDLLKQNGALCIYFDIPPETIDDLPKSTLLQEDALLDVVGYCKKIASYHLALGTDLEAMERFRSAIDRTVQKHFQSPKLKLALMGFGQMVAAGIPAARQGHYPMPKPDTETPGTAVPAAINPSGTRLTLTGHFAANQQPPVKANPSAVQPPFLRLTADDPGPAPT